MKVHVKLPKEIVVLLQGERERERERDAYMSVDKWISERVDQDYNII